VVVCDDHGLVRAGLRKLLECEPDLAVVGDQRLPRWPERRSLQAVPEKEAVMNTVVLIVVFAFVISVLALVGLALVEMSPVSRHRDHYRDPDTGERRFKSPRLDWGNRAGGPSGYRRRPRGGGRRVVQARSDT
jgi:hypothetical protein